MIAEADRRRKALHAFIDTRRTTPFAWGTHDCCIFGCDALHAIHGVDLAAGFRGTYTTSIGAGKIFIRMGVRSVEELADNFVNQGKLRAVRIGFALRGHLLILRRRGQVMLGVSVGEHGAFAGVNGLEFAMLCDCAKAYELASAGPVSQTAVIRGIGPAH